MAITFTHPAWKLTAVPRGVSDPDSNTLSRLLAGLQVTDKELVALIESLSAVVALGYVPAALAAGGAAAIDKHISISAASIALLFRHARLMRLLAIPVNDYIKLIRFSAVGQRAAADRYIRDLSDVVSISEFVGWQKTSGFSPDEIVFITGGVGLADTPNPQALVDDAVAGVKRSASFKFPETLFTQLGLTDVQSRKIINDNTTTAAANRAFVTLADGSGYSLREGVDPSAVALTLDNGIGEAALRELLLDYHFMRVLDVLLAGALSLDREQVEVIRNGAWTKVTLQIPVRKISPVMYRGRLYMFWIETTTRAVSSFQGGNTHFDGYRHLIRVKYSTTRADGAWTAPQSLSFAEGKVTEEGRSIEDPTLGVDAKQALQDQLDAVNDQIGAVRRSGTRCSGCGD